MPVTLLTCHKTASQLSADVGSHSCSEYITQHAPPHSGVDCARTVMQCTYTWQFAVQVCTRQEQEAARDELIQIYMDQNMPEEQIKEHLQVSK